MFLNNKQIPNIKKFENRINNGGGWKNENIFVNQLMPIIHKDKYAFH